MPHCTPLRRMLISHRHLLPEPIYERILKRAGKDIDADAKIYDKISRIKSKSSNSWKFDSFFSRVYAKDDLFQFLSFAKSLDNLFEWCKNPEFRKVESQTNLAQVLISNNLNSVAAAEATVPILSDLGATPLELILIYSCVFGKNAANALAKILPRLRHSFEDAEKILEYVPISTQTHLGKFLIRDYGVVVDFERLWIPVVSTSSFGNIELFYPHNINGYSDSFEATFPDADIMLNPAIKPDMIAHSLQHMFDSLIVGQLDDVYEYRAKLLQIVFEGEDARKRLMNQSFSLLAEHFQPPPRLSSIRHILSIDHNDLRTYGDFALRTQLLGAYYTLVSFYGVQEDPKIRARKLLNDSYCKLTSGSGLLRILGLDLEDIYEPFGKEQI